eukprot:364995-Chlamydomonas_euryale.AAC.7
MVRRSRCCVRKQRTRCADSGTVVRPRLGHARPRKTRTTEGRREAKKTRSRGSAAAACVPPYDMAKLQPETMHLPEGRCVTRQGATSNDVANPCQ